MNYKIKVNYRTGNSFNSEDVEDYINCEWATREDAETNLKFIEEHYHLYMLHNKEWNADKKQLAKSLEDAKTKKWFYNDGVKSHSDYWQYRINLYDRNGNLKQFSTFWCGYFEPLHWAEVEEVKNKNSRIEFR